MKKIKGFTLIELIVVIAIITILTAILIPTILGYVQKAKLEVANNNAKIIYNNASAFIHDAEQGNFDFKSISSIYSKEYPYENQSLNDLYDFIQKSISDDNNVWKIYFDEDNVLSLVYYSANDNDPYVGCAPTPIKTKTSGGIDTY